MQYSLGSGSFGEVKGDGTFVNKTIIFKQNEMSFLLSSLNKELRALLDFRNNYQFA